MIQPDKTTVEAFQTKGGLLLRILNLDTTKVGQGFLWPSEDYTLGTFQLADRASTSLSTGVLTLVCSNDPGGDVYVTHPDAITLSAAGVLSGEFVVTTGKIGVVVTTAQSSTAVDLWMHLRR